MCTSSVAYYYQKITETKNQNSLKFTANPPNVCNEATSFKSGLGVKPNGIVGLLCKVN